jgi:protein-S-isoprenylcysteine O-methyltransferase
MTIIFTLPSILGILYAVSELGLSIFKRAGKGAVAADRGSLGMIWAVILASVFAAFALPALLPALGFGPPDIVLPVGVAIFAAGIAFRWYAIVYLGRFFTVNVAIASDHRLLDGGPYRIVRHPSYTGALAAFLGLGICIGNWASLAALLLPTLLVFLRRIHVEEAALTAAFGDQYRDYMRRTKRLIPALY